AVVGGAIASCRITVCSGSNAAPCRKKRPLFETNQFDLEGKGGIRRDSRRPPLGAICQIRGNGQAALAAHFHAFQALFPAADDIPAAEPYRQRALAGLVE